MRGIAKYARYHGPWSFTSEPSWLEKPFDTWRDQIHDTDGFIIEEPQLAAKVAQTGFSNVISGTTHTDMSVLGDICYMTADNETVGKMAAEHFLKLGFKQFAFYGFNKVQWSIQRRKAFEERINKARFNVAVYEIASPKIKNSVDTHEHSLPQWLQTLPKPSGIMACNDVCGEQVIEACKVAQVQVPQQIAVIGVDNDDLLCEFSNPSLSSVGFDFIGAGHKAAETLDEMMAGKIIRGRKIIIESTHIVQRKSTDVLAVEDEAVATALQYIHQNVRKPIGVSEVVKAAMVSRRNLELRFRDILGCSIHDEIRRTRVNQVVRMLLETNYSILRICMVLRFSSVTNMARYFREEKDMSPLAFRKKFSHN